MKTPKEIFFVKVFELFKELAHVNGEVFEPKTFARKEWNYGQVGVEYFDGKYNIRRNGWLITTTKSTALVGLFLTHQFELLYGGEEMDGEKDGEFPDYYTKEYTNRLVKHMAG